MTNAAVILLAGGKGSRFGGAVPKQFVTLGDRLIIDYSYEVFSQLASVIELVVVCAPEYRSHFPEQTTFANPGAQRQDSVYNGLLSIKSSAEFICIHDGARPFVTAEIATRVMIEAFVHGAAAAGMPLKFTVKEHDGQGFVTKTPDRSTLWEIQTPQVIRRDWLLEGFRHTNSIVTDDVSLVEQIGHPVKLVEGSYQNIKITSYDDLILAQQFLAHSAASHV